MAGWLCCTLGSMTGWISVGGFMIQRSLQSNHSISESGKVILLTRDIGDGITG